ncbi:hypothetical protein VTL71DRAFT_14906 [Oculimacula yallundae]|uniref:Uncharacterized protein n=1 Tax=Oculimacula yallundae TaxID=86028 RepID=A0ABR4CHC0_9HELO
MDSTLSAQEFMVWLRPWLERHEESDLRLVQHIAIDRAWLYHSDSIPKLGVQVGELVRLLGNVKVLHLVSLNSHWSLQPWTMWRDIGRVPDDRRVEFTWVDMEEVRKRPAEHCPSLRKEWGEDSLMARAGPDVLSLEGQHAIARSGEVVQMLEEERLNFPTGWSMPRVQLDFVRYDRVKLDRRILEQEKAKASVKRGNAKAFLARATGELLPQLVPVSTFGRWFGRG